MVGSLYNELSYWRDQTGVSRLSYQARRRAEALDNARADFET